MNCIAKSYVQKNRNLLVQFEQVILNKFSPKFYKLLQILSFYSFIKFLSKVFSVKFLELF